ncbi:accessory Sec system protein Asp3 [Leuconostoc holzapfelii]|uniref:Accessory Sec system protein Asp3 n=1 Tax=Leuconostoc holzapfelii TaxID=434464 RepID=A0A846ZCG8_9LACO|nr:accessory Sec system protein Asp3 [Leuconostoc holzapfelii]NKZ17644.1 accessory Sec system protein Asp3 [Leuconostoc holzapfelii]
MTGNNFVIYWDHNVGETYLYGSEITYKSIDQVFFENNLMASGLQIHTWHSAGNFPIRRAVSPLPALQPGIKYQLTYDAEVIPETPLYIEIKFFDRFAQQITRKIIKFSGEVFEFPIATYQYEISLLSSGFSKMNFHSLKIQKQQEDNKLLLQKEGLSISDVMHASSSATTLRVIFVEPIVGTMAWVRESLIAQLDDVIQITSDRSYAQFYLSDRYRQLILETLSELQQDFDINTVQFIGYGPISSQAARFFATQVVNGVAHITDDFGQIARSERMQNIEGFEFFKQNEPDSDKFIIYHTPPKQNYYQMSQLSRLFDYSDRLEKYIDFIK